MAQTKKPNRPDKELVLEESETTLTMSYVMMNDIMRLVGGPDEAMTSILTNQEIRDLIIRRLFTDSKTSIEEFKDLIPIEDTKMDIFEMDDVLSWVMEHITYFFMRTAEKVQAAVNKYPELAKKMKTSSDPSEIGSTPSPKLTKSAGPTE